MISKKRFYLLDSVITFMLIIIDNFSNFVKNSRNAFKVLAVPKVPWPTYFGKPYDRQIAGKS